MDFGIASVAAITVICYLIGQVVKASRSGQQVDPVLPAWLWRCRISRPRTR